MKTALHLLNTYLSVSETFIWNTLSHLKEYHPLILASEFKNLETFPLPQGSLIQSHPEKSSLASLWAKLRSTYAPYNHQNCMKELSQYSVEIIHAHYGYRSIVSRPLIKHLNKPLITNFYGYDVSNKKFLERAYSAYQKLFKEGAAFIVEGPYMKKKLIALGCPIDKIHLHPICIDPNRYLYRHRTWDGKRKIKFLFVGRFVEKKGLLFALKALKKIEMAFPWEFNIIGDGPQMEAAKTYAKDYLPTDSIHFLGLVNPKTLPQYYDENDILIQPSQIASNGDSEGGAPTVLLEAQASGMLILSTFHNDIPFVLSLQHQKYLSPEKDVHHLTKQIFHLVESYKTWSEIAISGLQQINQQHNISVQTKVLEKLYNDLS